MRKHSPQRKGRFKTLIGLQTGIVALLVVNMLASQILFGFFMTPVSAYNVVTLGQTILPFNPLSEPFLTSIADSDADNTINQGDTVTYTLTFSEDMDASTLSASDLVNLGTAGITIGSIMEISPGVFQIQVTATTPGTLRLGIAAGADVKDAQGESMNTTSALGDDDVLQVETSSESNNDNTNNKKKSKHKKPTQNSVFVAGNSSSQSPPPVVIVSSPGNPRSSFEGSRLLFAGDSFNINITGIPANQVYDVRYDLYSVSDTGKETLAASFSDSQMVAGPYAVSRTFPIRDSLQDGKYVMRVNILWKGKKYTDDHPFETTSKKSSLSTNEGASFLGGLFRDKESLMRAMAWNTIVLSSFLMALFGLLLFRFRVVYFCGVDERYFHRRGDIV